MDGNKRAAFLCIGLFPFLNGWRLVASQAQAMLNLLAVAAGGIDEPTPAPWLREHTASR